MSVKVSIPKSEQRKLRKFFNDAKKRKDINVKKTMAEAGLIAESVAAAAAPVDKGVLWQNIRYVPIDFGYGAKVFTNVHYAKYQNNGTAYIKAKRFMEKGAAAGIQHLIKKLK